MNWKFWKSKTNLKGKGKKWLRGMHLLGILVLFVIGGAVAYLGNNTVNPLLIIFGFAGMAGGVMLFQQWRHMGEARILGEKGEKGEEGEVEGMPPNSLIISPNRIAFAYVCNPPGQSQKCYNDNKFYHILRDGKGEKQYQEFTLPDDDDKERYYDPGEFANPVTMPSNKKYFTWSASLMQQVSVGLMAVIIAGLIVGLIALGG